MEVASDTTIGVDPGVVMVDPAADLRVFPVAVVEAIIVFSPKLIRLEPSRNDLTVKVAIVPDSLSPPEVGELARVSSAVSLVILAGTIMLGRREVLTKLVMASSDGS